MNCCVVADSTELNLSQKVCVCQGLPLSVLLVELIRSYSNVVRTTKCVVSGATLKGIQCWSMSGAACNWYWATCLELQIDPQFVVAFVEPGCVWERPSYVPSHCNQYRASDRSAEGPRLPKVHLYLLAACSVQSPNETLVVTWVVWRALSDSLVRSQWYSPWWYRF